MWSRRFRPPALRWVTGSRALRIPAGPRGPRNSLRRREFPQPISRNRSLPQNAPSDVSREQLSSNYEYLSSTLRDTNPEQNSLLSPVHIPEDPNAILKERHPAAKILANSGLVVQRQLELMNVMLGFEQANRYVIMDANGNHVGYMAEQESGFGGMMARQWFRTHRSFVTHVFDKDENEVLRFHRPFSWINSRIRVYDPLELADAAYSPATNLQGASPTSLVAVAGGSNVKVSPLAISDMRVVGEAQQRWAPLRRKYDLFIFHPTPTAETDMGSKRISSDPLSQPQQSQLLHASGGRNDGGEYHQFAYVDEPFLSWDFSLRSADNRLIGSVNRNFAGFAREIFTDTGVYALRMDAAALAEEREQRHLISQTGQAPTAYTERFTGMTLDQRAVMLATAVSIDFDYFSRHSHSGGFMPLWFPGVGGEATAGGAAGEAGAAGAGAAGSQAAAASQAAGAGEAAAVGETGAGTLGRAGAVGSMAEAAASGAAGAGTIAGYEAMRRGLYSDAQTPVPEEQQRQGPPQPPPNASEEVWGESYEDFWGQGGGADRSGGFENDVEEEEGEENDWF
ncbi:hypothetical protein VTN77DRAFT_2738 [Rasamsonia byssochlamydoides]|uniref:uncharacterized protein n=1 Tax=Rasamsonia byssochlamydoides TaxID=89139 RepID=UPI003742C688